MTRKRERSTLTDRCGINHKNGIFKKKKKELITRISIFLFQQWEKEELISKFSSKRLQDFLKKNRIESKSKT